MDRLIKKKEPEYPEWLLNGLKICLLCLLCWNIHKNIPKSYFGVSQTSRIYPVYTTPNIEEVSFTQLLSTTQPKIDHFMKWGGLEIPFSDPEIIDNQAIPYQYFSKNTFKQIWTDSFSLNYKGHLLTPNKVNAIFIDSDGVITQCEDEGNFKNCFHSNLRHHLHNFALWLSIESEEGKTYFSRIIVSDDKKLTFEPDEKAIRYWKKLINRDKHKNIDNLSVAKPIFQNNDYLLKWGNWEGYPNGPKGGRRIKIGINEFKAWADNFPFLYKDGEYVPFSISVNHWNRKKWNVCHLNRKHKNTPLIISNDCFKNLIEQVEVGHTLSVFLHIKGDFVKNLSPNSLSALPGFMVNDQYIRFSLPLEIIDKTPSSNNAPLNLTTSTFGFQLNSSLGENSIVKMDTKNPKNENLLKHYSQSKTTKVIHVNNFKTVRRVITSDDIFVNEKEIKKKYTLPDKVFKTETFPEFYDFNIQPPLIKLNGLSTVLDKTAYHLKDFKQNKDGFEMYIGNEQVKLLQVTFTVVPKKGKAIQYITDNFTRNDMVRRLRKIKPETSLYFDKILFERVNGEQMVFPLATALHLK